MNQGPSGDMPRFWWYFSAQISSVKLTGEVSFPSVNVTLPFGTKYSVCDRNCQFLVVSVVIEFNPFYVGSDDAEEGFKNNEIDRSENN